MPKPVNQYLTSKNLYFAFIHIVVIALAVQVVILSRQNRQMKEGKPSVKQEQLQVGDSFFLDDLEPVQAGVALDTLSERQLIYIFTTTCPFCQEVLPVWKDVSSSVNRSLPIFAISLDSKESTLSYIERNVIAFPVFIPKDAESFKKRNKVHLTPMTVVRNAATKVEKMWVGRLNQEIVKELVLVTVPNKTNQSK